ncbi:MAG: Beta-lactamase class C-like and penicillin binding proteins (PBPs) superfamily, partial [uncultured Corynebacteriales bacterium]
GPGARRAGVLRGGRGDRAGRGGVHPVLGAGRPRRRDPELDRHPVRAGLGDEDVHRRRRRPDRAGPARAGGVAAAAGAPPGHPAARRDRAPPALPHLRHRRLRGGGGRGRGRVRRPLGDPALLRDDPAGRLPAAVRRPGAVRAARRAVALLQRRLRAARARRRGADRRAVHRGGGPAGVPAGRDGRQRVLPAGRAPARRRGRLPALRPHQRLLGAGDRRGGRRGVLDGGRPGPLPARVRGADRRPARADAHAARPGRPGVRDGLRRLPLRGRPVRPRRRRPGRRRADPAAAGAGRHRRGAGEHRGLGGRGARPAGRRPARV